MEDVSPFPEELLYAGLTPFLQQAVPPVALLNERPTTVPTLRQLFSYAAHSVPLAALTEMQWQDQEVIVERVSYHTGPLTRATALVVKPQKAEGPLPGLLLFHCHSGVYRWGSEKLCETSADAEALLRFRQEKYAGRSLARDFAEAGFLVVAPDTFYFGRRALGRAGVDAPEHEIDRFRRASESLIAKMLALAGHSWPAVIAWEDQKALDYLCSRPEVNPEQVGCLGLSLGGFQTFMLAARDQRISAAISAGWLTTVDDLLRRKISKHSWMVLPWGLLPTLDIPALAASACPAALLALLCTDDHLFTRTGMQAAAAELVARYRSAGVEDRCRVEFFAGPHAFTRPMQDLALWWMNKFLARKEESASGA